MSTKKNELPSTRHREGLLNRNGSCFACKLFAAPIMFLGGTYLALKNISIIREIGPPTLLKATFIGVPMVLYAGASLSLYQAYNILRDY